MTDPRRLPVVPPAPRTPSKRTRALIHAYTGAQSAKRIIGVVFTLVGVVVTPILGAGLPSDAAIALDGETARGTIVDVAQDRSVKVNGAHPWRVRFAHDGGAGTSTTFDGAWATSLARGATVEIERARAWPEAARVKGTRVSAIGWFALFPLVFGVIGAPLLVSAVRSNRREIRAFTVGRAAVARVTRFELDRTVKVNGRHPTVLAWTFDVMGETYTGSLSHMDRGVLEPLVVDDRIAIVYDEGDPRANTAYVA